MGISQNDRNAAVVRFLQEARLPAIAPLPGAKPKPAQSEAVVSLRCSSTAR
jgi:hypothetical protein